MAMLTRKEMREKAERTTSTATQIIEGEKAASEAKTARLRAMRAERDTIPATAALQGEERTGSKGRGAAGRSSANGI